MSFIRHVQERWTERYLSILQTKVGIIYLQELKEWLRKSRNVSVFMLFSCTGDSNSVSSSASPHVILDLPIKLSTLFMAVIMGLSSASCLFLDASIDIICLPWIYIVLIHLNLQLNATGGFEYEVWLKSEGQENELYSVRLLGSNHYLELLFLFSQPLSHSFGKIVLIHSKLQVK